MSPFRADTGCSHGHWLQLRVAIGMHVQVHRFGSCRQNKTKNQQDQMIENRNQEKWPENMAHTSLVGGWPTPLKNDGVKVSWDDYSIPNWMESHNPFMFQSPPTRSIFTHLHQVWSLLILTPRSNYIISHLMSCRTLNARSKDQNPTIFFIIHSCYLL